MSRLRAAELLDLWERAVDRAPVPRALALLTDGGGDDEVDALARLHVGERDRRLLARRRQAFGSAVTALAACEQCGETIELSFDLGVLAAEGSDDPEGGYSVTAGGRDVRFRLPMSVDLLKALVGTDPAEARAGLLESCAVSVDGSGPLPVDVADAVTAAMAEADPHAEVRLSARCGACGHDGDVVFDIGAFFWEELDAWARRIALQVDALARAYGWREPDILSMSARRRALYLELAGA